MERQRRSLVGPSECMMWMGMDPLTSMRWKGFFCKCGTGKFWIRLLELCLLFMRWWEQKPATFWKLRSSSERWTRTVMDLLVRFVISLMVQFTLMFLGWIHSCMLQGWWFPENPSGWIIIALLDICTDKSSLKTINTGFRTSEAQCEIHEVDDYRILLCKYTRRESLEYPVYFSFLNNNEGKKWLICLIWASTTWK